MCYLVYVYLIDLLSLSASRVESTLSSWEFYEIITETLLEAIACDI